MYVDTWMLLVIYLFAASSLLIALWALLTLQEVLRNGRTWVALNRSLSQRVDTLESANRWNRKP